MPPAHVGLHDVAGFREAQSLGEVTGVFDCEYPDCDEDAMSKAELRDQVTYEVEVLPGNKDCAAFFGFKGKDRIRFNVPAEMLWGLPEGKALATAYELYFYTEYGVWGTPMTAAGRVQQVSRTVLDEVRRHKRDNRVPADAICEIAKLWLEAVSRKAANYLRQQEISDLLTECCRLKSQQSAALTQGVLTDISWLAAAQAGKRFVTQRESAMPSTCTLYESDLDSGVDMHVLGQILLKSDDDSESVMWITSTTNPDPVYTKSGLLFPMWAGDGRVYYIPDESVAWRRKFLHRNLARSVSLYDAWHLEQVGESPSRRLGSMLRLGSPVLLADVDAPLRHVGVSEL